MNLFHRRHAATWAKLSPFTSSNAVDRYFCDSGDLGFQEKKHILGQVNPPVTILDLTAAK